MAAAAVRGGIPVCFPQFADLGPLPAHGFARNRRWTLATERSGKDFALVGLSSRTTRTAARCGRMRSRPSCRS